MAETRRLFGKSVALREPLPAGTVLRLEHLTLRKPGGGLGRDLIAQLVGHRLVRSVPTNRLLRLDDLESDGSASWGVKSNERKYQSPRH